MIAVTFEAGRAFGSRARECSSPTGDENFTVAEAENFPQINQRRTFDRFAETSAFRAADHAVEPGDPDAIGCGAPNTGERRVEAVDALPGPRAVLYAHDRAEISDRDSAAHLADEHVVQRLECAGVDELPDRLR